MSYSSIDRRPDSAAVFAALDSCVNTVECSSMGRLFDAVAALLGVHDVSSYEGESAIMLENAAAEARRGMGRSRAGDLALKFHMDVAAMTARACGRIRDMTGAGQVALSGGVFQNKVLLEEVLRLLRKGGFDVYCNSSAPPNDGGVSLGQAYVGMRYLSAMKEGAQPGAEGEAICR
jgi:hydrogenase maturation protein HypF